MNSQEAQDFLAEQREEFAKIDRNIFYKPIEIGEVLFDLYLHYKDYTISKIPCSYFAYPDFKKGQKVVLLKMPYWDRDRLVLGKHRLVWYPFYENFDYFGIENRDYLGVPIEQAYGLIENIKVL